MGRKSPKPRFLPAQGSPKQSSPNQRDVNRLLYKESAERAVLGGHKELVGLRLRQNASVHGRSDGLWPELFPGGWVGLTNIRTSLSNVKGDLKTMKKVLTIAFTMLMAAGLTFAQATGGSTDKTSPPLKTEGKKATKTSKAHKGGKKSKKGSSSTTPTTQPK